MKISIFLSYPKPFLEKQRIFIERIRKYLIRRDFEPRTLGVTDYNIDAPLKAIRRLMLESNGLITIAFRKSLVFREVSRPGEPFDEPPDEIDSNIKHTDKEGILIEPTMENVWYTSPYCHIEPAMAYQIGLPILILREQGVIAEGILEKGVTGLYMPEFDLDKPSYDYFKSSEWRNLIGQWEGKVWAVVETKGNPPKLY